MSSQNFTAEFKQEAVRQVSERGYPVAEVAARVGSQPIVCTSGSKPFHPINQNNRLANCLRPEVKCCEDWLNPSNMAAMTGNDSVRRIIYSPT